MSAPLTRIVRIDRALKGVRHDLSEGELFTLRIALLVQEQARKAGVQDFAALSLADLCQAMLERQAPACLEKGGFVWLADEGAV